MKKIILTSATIVTLCGQVAAQGAYVNVGGGYGFSSASVDMGNNTTISTTSGTYEGVSGSLGKGISFGAAFGYMFNEYVGAELGLGYLLGGKTESKYSSTGASTTTTDYSWSGKMMRISPSLLISGGKEGMVPYARFGITLGLGASAINMSNGTSTDTSIGTSSQKWEYSGGLAFGFNGAAGVKYGLNDKMFIYAELGLINMSWAPSKGVMTEKITKGKDELADTKVKDKETEYVDSYTDIFASPAPDTAPRKSTKWYLPFSSVGINLGLNINF